MKFNTHETDLYILPETQKERHNLQSFMKTCKYSYKWSFSDVQGQSWYGKQFMEIPFGIDLKSKIETYFND